MCRRTRSTAGCRKLIVPDAAAWREWLEFHHHETAGVRLVLAKKGTHNPTSLSYGEALDEALCFGWIDGQVAKRDAATYRQRFTPRRPRSPWSRRNVGITERLIAQGRMRPAGAEQIERARSDGRWDAAYTGQAAAEVPPDLAEALTRNAAAQAMFDRLTRQNRYAILYRVGEAKRAETRARRIAQFLDMLARGETVYPQKAR